MVGQLKPEGGLAALRQAYEAGEPDSAYGARAAAIAAMAAYGSEALESVRQGLVDRDWAVRVRTVETLSKLEPSAEDRKSVV